MNKIPEETPNLEETTITEEKKRFDRETNTNRAFNVASSVGLIIGLFSICAGIKLDLNNMEGFGYGILAMDAYINFFYRGIRYLQGRK